MSNLEPRTFVVSRLDPISTKAKTRLKRTTHREAFSQLRMCMKNKESENTQAVLFLVMAKEVLQQFR